MSARRLRLRQELPIWDLATTPGLHEHSGLAPPSFWRACNMVRHVPTGHRLSTKFCDLLQYGRYSTLQFPKLDTCGMPSVRVFPEEKLAPRVFSYVHKIPGTETARVCSMCHLKITPGTNKQPVPYTTFPSQNMPAKDPFREERQSRPVQTT